MIIVQKAVIKKGERYLVLLRPADKKHFPGCWDFPGGKLDEGEDAFEGLKREVLEETKLKIDALKVVSSRQENLFGKSYDFVTYEADLISDSLELNEEHVDSRWALKNEILALERITPTVEYYFKGN